MDLKNKVIGITKKAKAATQELAILDTATKDRALLKMADELIVHKDTILKENAKDLKAAYKMSSAFLKRLRLNEKRIKLMADSLRQIAKLKDPVDELIKSWQRPNGLLINKIRVPFGVIAIIYEARPNVTSDCIGLCLKSANTVILRGGSLSLKTNLAIYKILEEAALKSGIPSGAINLIPYTDRRVIDIILKLDTLIDLVMPRGGEGLIKEVVEKSRIPVIKHYKGICHVYVDRDANLTMAQNISFNAKCQRPGVCNAMETLLVHKDVSVRFLPAMIRQFKEANVEVRGCPMTYKIAKGTIKKAKELDWSTEYLDLIISIKVVDSLDEAIRHINYYGSHHSDSIITEDSKNAQRFLRRVDSACVYWNASTRFTDGYEFGLGAEIGISTDKLHARGPVALEELTTYKYTIIGSGQIRS